MKELTEYIKKSEFEEILDQIESDLKTTPVDKIWAKIPNGAYYLNDEGYWPVIKSLPYLLRKKKDRQFVIDVDDLEIKEELKRFELMGFKKYPFKDERERIKIVQKLNIIIKKCIILWEKERNRKIDKAIDAKVKEINVYEDITKEEVKREFEVTSMNHPPKPQLIPEYPVDIVYNKANICYTLDNNALFQLCLQEGENTKPHEEVAGRWNKTVYDYYSKMAPKIEIWFIDRGIRIKDVYPLFDEQPEKEMGKKSKKTVKNTRTLKQYKALEKKYYRLIKQERYEGYNNKDLADILFRDEYNNFYGRKYHLDTIKSIIKKKMWNYTLNKD